MAVCQEIQVVTDVHQQVFGTSQDRAIYSESLRAVWRELHSMLVEWVPVRVIFILSVLACGRSMGVAAASNLATKCHDSFCHRWYNHKCIGIELCLNYDDDWLLILLKWIWHSLRFFRSIVVLAPVTVTASFLNLSLTVTVTVRVNVQARWFRLDEAIGKTVVLVREVLSQQNVEGQCLTEAHEQNKLCNVRTVSIPRFCCGGACHKGELHALNLIAFMCYCHESSIVLCFWLRSCIPIVADVGCHGHWFRFGMVLTDFACDVLHGEN